MSTVTFDPDHGPGLPVQTAPQQQRVIMERDHAQLLPEQDKREPFVNSVEHGAKTFLADVEKVAAQTLTNSQGGPVLRRIYVDDAAGIPFDSMPVLLRQYGLSSKPSTVFSGNHGMGLILANGVDNPAGLVLISKTADADGPYLAYHWLDPATGNYELRTFWVADEDSEDGAEGEFLPVVTPYEFDGIDWMAVWESAYDNPKFNGPPESGTVVIELGKVRGTDGVPTDSTYIRSQSTFNPKMGRWTYSRWGTGQFYNARFWTLPIDVFWGVPQGNAMLEEIPASGFASNKWGYRTATGLLGQISVVTRPPKNRTADDAELPEETTQVEDDVCVIDGVLPARVEVYLRTLPDGIEARKLNFQVRRQGKIFIDYNGEIFEHPDPVSAHASFGMTHPSLRENVWVRIIPNALGEETPGGVWMGNKRKDLSLFLANGSSIDIPWTKVAADFRAAMPDLIIAAIKRLDGAHTDLDSLRDKRMQKWWEKVARSFSVKRKVTRTVDREVEVPATKVRRELGGLVDGEPGGTPRKTGRTRGPVVNPNTGTHNGGGLLGEEIGTRRRAPGRPITKTQKQVQKVKETTEQEVPGKNPMPPLIDWVEDIDNWGSEARWGVMYEEPSPANDERGCVRLNWNHWYLQQKFDELAGENGIFRTEPQKVKEMMQFLFGMSAATKIGHRRVECSSRDIGVTPQERETIFSAPALTGFLLGVWDQEQRLLSSLGGSVRTTSDDAAAV